MHKFRGNRRSALTLALLPLFLLVPLLYWGGGWLAGQLLAAERARAEGSVAQVAGSLRGRFEDIEAKLEDLAAFVARKSPDGSDVEPARFDEFAEAIHAGARWIRTLQLVTNGVITQTYPVAGNEKVLGYNLIADPRPVISGDLILGKRIGRTTVTGPIELVQGGYGMIFRKPVEQANKAQFHWVAIVVNLDDFLSSAGIVDDTRDTLKIALRRDTGEVFFGQPEVLAGQPVTRRIDVMGGYWEVAGHPAGGWQAGASPWLRLLFWGGAALVVLLSLCIYRRVNAGQRHPASAG